MMYPNKKLILAVVTDIQDTCVTYPGCRDCFSKLLVDPVSQRYHCIKCNSSCCGNQVFWRYRLVVTIADNSAMGNVTVFGRTLEPLFGKTAADFHKSMSDLEKTGYPAECLLLQALQHIFQGKYFYFGFKLAGTWTGSLEDVIKSNNSGIQTHSQINDHFDNYHSLAYQILPLSASTLTTVTGHIRETMHSLKHGHTMIGNFHKSIHGSELSKTYSPQNCLRNSTSDSYVDNSKQDSIVFSFEESSDNTKNIMREHYSHFFTSKASDDFEKRCSTAASGSFPLCSTNGSRLQFEKRKFATSKCLDYNQDLSFFDDVLTDDLVQQEYTCITKGLEKSNTSSKIDHELRVREIKCSAESFRQAILSGRHSKGNVQRSEKQPRSQKDRNKSQISGTVNETQSKDVLSVSKEQNFINAQDISINDPSLTQTNLFIDNDELHTSIGTEVKGINGVVLPDSEGLETFLETHFTNEALINESDKNDTNINRNEENISLVKIEDFQKASVSKLPSSTISNAKPILNGVNKLDCMLNDLPESEDLEAFLSSFNDGVKDSGLYSDTTGTSEESKKTSKILDDIGNKSYIFSADYRFHLKSDISSREGICGNSVYQTMMATNTSIHNQTEIRPTDILNTNHVENHVDTQDLIDESSSFSDESSDLEKYLGGIDLFKETSKLNDSKVKQLSKKAVNENMTNKAKVKEEDTEQQSARQERAAEDMTHIQNFTYQEKSMIKDDSQTEVGECNIDIFVKTEEKATETCRPLVEAVSVIKIAQTKEKSILKSLEENNDVNVTGQKILSESSSDTDGLSLSDMSNWNEVFEDAENHVHLLDVAVVSIKDDSASLDAKSQTQSIIGSNCDSCYAENGRNDTSLSERPNGSPWFQFDKEQEMVFARASPNSPLDTTSSDLFGETDLLQGLNEIDNSLENKIHVFAVDSETENIFNNHLEYDDSIIIDSPNTFVDEKSSLGNNLQLFYKNKETDKKQLNAMKNVKFDRQLRRVSSCQLMDLKMKLNESPYKDTKIKRKSCLKVKGARLEGKEPTGNNISINDGILTKFRGTALSGVEEKSHQEVTDARKQKEVTPSETVYGSQDLFVDTEFSKGVHVSVDPMRSHKLDTQHTGKEFDREFIGTTPSTETKTDQKVKLSDLSETGNLLIRNLSVTEENNTSNDYCGSQDLFTESPISCLLDVKNISSDLNTGKIQNNCISKSILYAKNKSNSKMKYENWLKNVLLDITNFADDLQANKDETKSNKGKISNSHLVVIDTPRSNDYLNLNTFKLPTTKNCSFQSLSIRKESEGTDTFKKDVQKVNSAMEAGHDLNKNIVVENSPDLFGDSPCCNSNSVFLQLKPNSKSKADTLCKKLFLAHQSRRLRGSL